MITSAIRSDVPPIESNPPRGPMLSQKRQADFRMRRLKGAVNDGLPARLGRRMRIEVDHFTLRIRVGLVFGKWRGSTW